MALAHCLKVLLVSALRRRVALVVVVAVLPPILVTLALAVSPDVVELVSEDLLRHLAGKAMVVSNEPVGGDCAIVGYGLIRLVRSDGSAITVPALYALDVEGLSKLLGVSLLEEVERCPTPAVLLPRGFVVPEAQQLAYAEAPSSGEILGVCSTMANIETVGSPMVVGGTRGYAGTGYLCSVSSARVGLWVVGSAVSEVSQFASRCSLLVTAAYAPALYLATLKVLDAVKPEVLVLSNLGVSRRKLVAVLTSFCSILVLAASLYCLSLGYSVLLLGRVLLAHLGVAVLPAPTLGVRHLLLPATLSLLEAPLAYLALRGACRRVPG